METVNFSHFEVSQGSAFPGGPSPRDPGATSGGGDGMAQVWDFKHSFPGSWEIPNSCS